MNFKKLSIPEVVLFEPKLFHDDRGFFFESFNDKEFNKAIGTKVDFVQDNHSFSKHGVLRGLHYQLAPFAQGKLVRVAKGEVLDIAVDLRKSSKTFGKWVGEILSEENNRQLWVPEGFGHGFVVLSKEAHFLYKTTNYYSKSHERSIKYNDPDLNIDWKINPREISEKDFEGEDFVNAEVFK